MKLFLLLLLLPVTVFAQISGELGLHSNYLWRGTTFSDNQPVVQLDLKSDAGSGFYVETFVSNATIVDPSRDKMTHEVDAILGKVWQGNGWRLNTYFNKYFFPGAGVYDTHEYVAQLEIKRSFFRASQMDDIFGYGSIYRYFRAGQDWTYKEGLDGGLYVGYNTFSDQKKAGNSDYFDVSLVSRKQIYSGTASLTLNWTNRRLITDEGKENAKDLAFVVGYTLPFDI